MKLVLFDIDGTLLRTGGAGKIAFNRVYADLFGCSEAWQQLVPDGKTDPKIIEELTSQNLSRALTPHEYNAVSELYIQYFEHEIKQAPNFRLLPGVQSLLKALSARSDIRIGLATGNFKKTADIKLKRGAIDHFFSFGGFACDSSDRAELTKAAVQKGLAHAQQHIQPKDIYLIGDTCHDIAAGKANSLRTIAVATGGTSVETLERCKPDHLFKDFSEFQQVLKIILHDIDIH